MTTVTTAAYDGAKDIDKLMIMMKTTVRCC